MTDPRQYQNIPPNKHEKEHSEQGQLSTNNNLQIHNNLQINNHLQTHNNLRTSNHSTPKKTSKVLKTNQLPIIEELLDLVNRFFQKDSQVSIEALAAMVNKYYWGIKLYMTNPKTMWGWQLELKNYLYNLETQIGSKGATYDPRQTALLSQMQTQMRALVKKYPPASWPLGQLAYEIDLFLTTYFNRFNNIQTEIAFKGYRKIYVGKQSNRIVRIDHDTEATRHQMYLLDEGNQQILKTFEDPTGENQEVMGTMYIGEEIYTTSWFPEEKKKPKETEPPAITFFEEELESMAQQLFKAFDGVGTDEAQVLNILERIRINLNDFKRLSEVYKKKYSAQRGGRSLSEDLFYELKDTPEDLRKAFALLEIKKDFLPYRQKPSGAKPVSLMNVPENLVLYYMVVLERRVSTLNLLFRNLARANQTAFGKISYPKYGVFMQPVQGSGDLLIPPSGEIEVEVFIAYEWQNEGILGTLAGNTLDIISLAPNTGKVKNLNAPTFLVKTNKATLISTFKQLGRNDKEAEQLAETLLKDLAKNPKLDEAMSGSSKLAERWENLYKAGVNQSVRSHEVILRKFDQYLGNEALGGEFMAYIQKVNPQFFNYLGQDKFWQALLVNFHEWKELKNIHIGGVGYVKKYEDIKIAEDPGGIGQHKAAFDIKGNDDAILLKFHDEIFDQKTKGQIIKDQMTASKELDNVGIPVVEYLGVTYHNGAPSVIMKKHVADHMPSSTLSDELEGLIKKNPKIVETMRQDINLIKEKVKQYKLYIEDIQFMISEKGRVMLHDIEKVHFNSPKRIDTIDALDDFLNTLPK